MGNAGGIKEILCSLSEFFMSPIAELAFKMTAIMTFYRIKCKNSEEIFKQKKGKSEEEND